MQENIRVLEIPTRGGGRGCDPKSTFFQRNVTFHAYLIHYKLVTLQKGQLAVGCSYIRRLTLWYRDLKIK